jgi:hypothetical protein
MTFFNDVCFGSEAGHHTLTIRFDIVLCGVANAKCQIVIDRSVGSCHWCVPISIVDGDVIVFWGEYYESSCKRN